MPAAPAVAVSDDVREAVAAGRPVVALETTIITHGLPRPRNVTTALEAEALLREAGVVPATIGVVGGRPTVGLAAEEIERLGGTDAVHKIGTRDLPVAMAQGWSGGTTVAATALLAHRAGVGVFAIGGLGGVHRCAATTFDESADLVALAGLPILVVSAGVKSILDVGATLERLETLGVTVLGYRTATFPGFYVRDSGFGVTDRVETASRPRRDRGRGRRRGACPRCARAALRGAAREPRRPRANVALGGEVARSLALDEGREVRQ